MNLSDHITFSELHVHYAVCFIDMIDSTTIVSHLSGRDADTLYMSFLNILTEVIQNTGGKVLKTFGDGIFYYFPRTDFGVLADFEQVITSCQATLAARPRILEQLKAEGLPEINYRLSASFGPVSVVENDDKEVADLFGSTVNTCAKMNRLAQPNSMIIGSALHDKLSGTTLYAFEPAEQFSVNDNLSYMTYRVSNH
jgi:class 3 adenylate cyclase